MSSISLPLADHINAGLLSPIDKQKLDNLTGAVVYQGTWNATTNSPAIVGGTGTQGYYYKVSVAGTTSIDGISQWNVGDTIIFDGSTWDKIDGISNEVVSVAGLYGVISASGLKSALAISSGDVSGLGALATLTPGAGVDTALGNAVDGSGGLVSKNSLAALTTASSGTNITITAQHATDTALALVAAASQSVPLVQLGGIEFWDAPGYLNVGRASQIRLPTQITYNSNETNWVLSSQTCDSAWSTSAWGYNVANGGDIVSGVRHQYLMLEHDYLNNQDELHYDITDATGANRRILHCNFFKNAPTLTQWTFGGTLGIYSEDAGGGTSLLLSYAGITLPLNGILSGIKQDDSVTNFVYINLYDEFETPLNANFPGTVKVGGYLGVGTASPNYPVDINGSTSTSNSPVFRVLANGDASGSAAIYGAKIDLVNGSAGNSLANITALAVTASSILTGSSKPGALFGFSTATTNQNSGTLSSQTEYQSGPAVYAGATTTDLMHINLRDVYTNSGAGIVGTQYGLYVTNLTGAATNYAIYTGTGTVRFGDLVQFAGTNTTGSGSAALGSNCPALTATAPYTWVESLAADGSTVYIPAWK